MDVDVARTARYWYPDDGGAVWLEGFWPVGDSGLLLAREAPELRERGLHLASLAGGRHHLEGLTSAGAQPPAPLALRRDAANVHDPSAIAVETAAGAQVGWIPRELAAGLAPRIDRGERWSALALRERRASPRDPREGLTLLLAAARELRLRIRGDQ